MADSIFRGVSPGTDTSPPRLEVVSPPGKGFLDATVLGYDVLGVPAHWTDDVALGKRRSVICAGAYDLCVLCGVEPPSPLFFVAIWDHGPNSRAILRLGREGARALEECSRRVGTLRGLRVEIADVPGRAGRQLVCVQARPAPLTPLIAPHPIDPTVAKLFKVKALPGWLTRRELCGVDGSPSKDAARQGGVE